MLISLTVGKVDAGLAILLTEDKRLIEFPSILLPAGIVSGSIVDIQVSRNAAAESSSRDSFSALQNEIYNSYGVHSPKKPVLKVRNATQTSIVLEWDPIELATAQLRNLTLYRNGAKAGAIPNPTSHTATKISGLAVDTEYKFHLVLRTSAGTYLSDKVTVRTHRMTDLSGITVCPGVMSAEVRESLEATLSRIGAKPLQDTVRIDTTQFVCTEGRGQAWERAQEMNIPVVRPEWVDACERDGRIVMARQFYLGADLSKGRSNIAQRTSAQQIALQSTTSSPSSHGNSSVPLPRGEATNAESDARDTTDVTSPTKTSADDEIEEQIAEEDIKKDQDSLQGDSNKINGASQSGNDENFVSVQL